MTVLARKRLPAFLAILSMGIASFTAVALTEANAKPQVRDHRGAPTWQPPKGPQSKHQPIIRDHRKPETWTPKKPKFPGHYP
jgi:hypothetical protein